MRKERSEEGTNECFEWCWDVTACACAWRGAGRTVTLYDLVRIGAAGTFDLLRSCPVAARKLAHGPSPTCMQLRRIASRR